MQGRCGSMSGRASVTCGAKIVRLLLSRPRKPGAFTRADQSHSTMPKSLTSIRRAMELRRSQGQSDALEGRSIRCLALIGTDDGVAQNGTYWTSRLGREVVVALNQRYFEAKDRFGPISDNRTIVNSLVLSNHLDRTRAGDESRMWRDEKPYSSGATGGTSVIRRAPRLKVT
jgi:hypothetical protein